VSCLRLCTLIFAFLSVLLLPQQGSALQCKQPPRQIQLHFAFDWPLSERGALFDYLSVHCGEPENLAWAGHQIKAFFNARGVGVTEVKLAPPRDRELVEFYIRTANDSAAQRAVMYELNIAGHSRAQIPVLKLTTSGTGTAEDGQELKASFAVDQQFAALTGGRVAIQWLRNGQAIPDALRSRYRLGEQDIGTAISAIVSIHADGRILAFREQKFDRQIVLSEQLPQARNLRLSGTAKLGHVITADYEFSDRNPEDSESGTTIIWLRGNTAVNGAGGRSYMLTRADVGQIISAMVIPATDDGVTGVSQTASLPVPVNDGKVVLDEALMNKALPASMPAPPPENDIERIFTAPAGNSRVDESLKPRLSVNDNLYLTKGLRLNEGSPRQVTGLFLADSQLLSDAQIKAIETRFIGRDITLVLLQEILEAFNDAFKEAGFELSRALLPEQNIDDGRIEIKIVEVTIGKITVENNDAVSDRFILNQLGYQPGDFISLATFEQRLKNYNATNKSKLTTELAPGEAYGTTDIFIRAEEPDPIELPTLSLDNYNKDLSRVIPQSFSTTINNMFSRDDEISVSLSDGAGTSAYSFGLSLPVGSNGVNVSVNAAGAETKSTNENAELVGYRGSSSSFGTSLSAPLYSSLKWSIFGSAAYGSGTNDMVAPVTGDLLAKSSTRKLLLSLPVSFSDGITSFSVTPSWHLIHTKTEIPPNNKWVQKFDLSSSLSHFISPKVTANLAGRLLYTNARTFLNMPDEIISIGGPGSVRAYRPSESSGYRGYFVTGELRTDAANWDDVNLPEWLPGIQPYLFIDHANAREVYGQSRRGDMWSGYGAGLSLPQVFNYFSFDTYWAQPLDGAVHQQEKDAYKDDLLQFSLRANLKFN